MGKYTANEKKIRKSSVAMVLIVSVVLFSGFFDSPISEYVLLISMGLLILIFLNHLKLILNRLKIEKSDRDNFEK